MTQHVPRLPFPSDPLIAEAKQRARRRRWLTLLVVVAAVAAVPAGLELRSAFGSGLAAAREKPVVHVVLEQPTHVVTVNLKTGRRSGGQSREELWLDRQNGQERIVNIESGRVIGDVAQTNHFGPTSEAAAVDQVYLSLGSSFRASLRNGAAMLVGHGTFDGHDIDWLALRQLPVPAWRHGHPWPQAAKTDIGVDAHTLRPVVLRFRSSRGTRGGYYVHVLEARAIAYRPTDFKRRVVHVPVALQKTVTGFAFGSANRSTGSKIVPAPWLTAGTAVAGLRLRAVVPFTISRSKHHFSYNARRPKPMQGLELVYGPASYDVAPTIPARTNVYGKGPRGATRFTTVYEVPRALRVYPWSRVPAGSMRIQSGLTTVGHSVVRTLRIGYLQKRGLFITIRTPQDQQTAVRIARSLRSG